MSKIIGGSKIEHKRYGESIVVEINDLGYIIEIENTKGKIQLAADSGVTFNRLLEDDKKQLELKE